MTYLRKMLGWVVGSLLALFLVLWFLGQTPVSMGPYVQTVTASSAEVCAFDEVERCVRVILKSAGKEPVTIIEDEPVRAHRVRFSGLAPDTQYVFVITVVGEEPALFTGRFKTAPKDTGQPFQFVVAGDTGDVPNWFKLHRFGFGRLRPGLQYLERTGQWDVAEWMAARRPDFFFHLGDVIYSHNQLPAYEEAFFRPFRPVVARCALFTTFGNHDLHNWDHPEFFEVFHTPKELNLKRGFRDYSYSFVWGDVRFLVLDLYYQKWDEGSEMHSWLQETLRASPQSHTVVLSHYPPFTDEASNPEKTQPVFQKIWPMLWRHGVCLVVGGNSHSYQRFWPVNGVTTVVVGTGGKSIRPVAPSDRLAHYEERFGFLLVKVDKTRIEGEFWAGGAQPVDRFVAVR